jgi:hypothetical protein
MSYHCRECDRPPFYTGPEIQEMVDEHRADRRRDAQRRRSRSRSPTRRDRDRYDDDDSRSRSRDRYRSSRRERSPANGHYDDRGSRGAPPVRSFEERQQHKAEMVSHVRDQSKQERRVYVGNLPYDVKWHSLKDFMKEGL